MPAASKQLKVLRAIFIGLVAVVVSGAAIAAAAHLWLSNAFGLQGNDEPIACEDFEFSPADWREKPQGGWHVSRTITERERIADAFHRCGTLHGKRRAEVEAMLGRGNASRDGSRVSYDIGWVNDGIGVGDGYTLTLRYDERDRVVNLPGGQEPPHW